MSDLMSTLYFGNSPVLDNVLRAQCNYNSELFSLLKTIEDRKSEDFQAVMSTIICSVCLVADCEGGGSLILPRTSEEVTEAGFEGITVFKVCGCCLGSCGNNEEHAFYKNFCESERIPTEDVVSIVFFRMLNSWRMEKGIKKSSVEEARKARSSIIAMLNTAQEMLLKFQ